MSTFKGNLRYHMNNWWVNWGAKSQMIDNSVDTSNFVEGDSIEFRLSMSMSDERWRAFPV
jgi:hypothetical protein